jgi:predicted DNA-binding protein
MFERNMISVQGGLFAGKGKAKPTADYVPEPSTESTAADSSADKPSTLVDRAAEAIPGSDGLGTLILRRVAVGQETAGYVEAEAQRELEFRNDYAQADHEAAQRVERESAELTAKAAEQDDPGMLYETLRMGLPSAPVDDAPISATPPAVAEEVSAPLTPELEPPVIAPPPPPDVVETQPSANAGPGQAVAPKKPKRRKMTVRLQQEEWQRLKSYANETDRTYQDIISTATTSYLDEILDDETAAAPPEPARPADLGNPESRAAKSPYDWFRSNKTD